MRVVSAPNLRSQRAISVRAQQALGDARSDLVARTVKYSPKVNRPDQMVVNAVIFTAANADTAARATLSRLRVTSAIPAFGHRCGDGSQSGLEPRRTCCYSEPGRFHSLHRAGSPRPRLRGDVPSQVMKPAWALPQQANMIAAGRPFVAREVWHG